MIRFNTEGETSRLIWCQKGNLMSKQRDETSRGSKWFGAETSEKFSANRCTELIDWFTDF